MVDTKKYWDAIDRARGAISWERVAEKVGIAKSTILRTKKNNQTLNMEHTSAIADFLKMKMDQLCQQECSNRIDIFQEPECNTYTECWWCIVDDVRREKKMKWSDIGEKAGKSDRTIVTAKNRGSSLSFELAVRILDILEIDIEAMDCMCHEHIGNRSSARRIFEERFSMLAEKDQAIVLSMINSLLQKNNNTSETPGRK